MSLIVTLDAESIHAFTATPGQLALVDFWAPWCSHCQRLTPQLETLSEEYAGRIKFGKLNVDKYHEQAKTFQVRNLPSLLLFRDGQQVAVSIGMKNIDVLRNWLDSGFHVQPVKTEAA